MSDGRNAPPGDPETTGSVESPRAGTTDSAESGPGGRAKRCGSAIEIAEAGTSVTVEIRCTKPRGHDLSHVAVHRGVRRIWPSSGYPWIIRTPAGRKIHPS